MARFRRSPTPTNRERFLGNLLTTPNDDWSDYLSDAFQLLARAKELFPTLAHSELLAGAKHSPPTTEEFRAWLAGKLSAFFAGA